MATMKVHGDVLSIATQRVLACLYEKQLNFELVPVDVRTGAHKKQPFISLNPFGQVPAFEEGDMTLFDVAVVQENEAKLVQVLDIYEVRLAQSKYLGGDDFTLVDLHHIPCIHRLMGSQMMKKLFDSRPHVSAWYVDILARPAWLKVLAMQANH